MKTSLLTLVLLAASVAAQNRFGGNRGNRNGGNNQNNQNNQNQNNQNQNNQNNQNQNNNQNNNNQNPQESLTLDPSVLCTACTDNGQNPPVDGQSASLTSTNNFLAFCAGKTLTNGQQVTGGSCNGVVMGEIIPQNNMPAAKITFPTNGGTFPADQSFQFKMSIQNMITGNFVNAQTNYYGAPQFLQGNTVVGHSHVTVQLLPDIKTTEPLNPTTFAFFKGINTPDQGGVLTVDVTNGLPAGAYRFCTMNTSANHTPLMVAVAQHGSLDDCIYATAVAGGGNNNGNNGNNNNGNNNNGNNNNGNNGNNGNNNNGANNGNNAQASTASAAVSTTSAAAAATSSAAANTGNNQGGNRGGRRNRGGNRNRGGRSRAGRSRQRQ